MPNSSEEVNMNDPIQEKLSRVREILVGSNIFDVQKRLEELLKKHSDRSIDLENKVDGLNKDLRYVIKQVSIRLEEAINDLEKEFEKKDLKQNKVIEELGKELNAQKKIITANKRIAGKSLKEAIDKLKAEFKVEIEELRQKVLMRNNLASVLSNLSSQITDEDSQTT